MKKVVSSQNENGPVRLLKSLEENIRSRRAFFESDSIDQFDFILMGYGSLKFKFELLKYLKQKSDLARFLITSIEVRDIDKLKKKLKRDSKTQDKNDFRSIWQLGHYFENREDASLDKLKDFEKKLNQFLVRLKSREYFLETFNTAEEFSRTSQV